MKNESDKITFKELLKTLRPELRPSLAKKEFERLLRSIKRREIFNNYEMQGRTLDARRRIISILDTPEHVNVESPVDTDVSKTDTHDPQATGDKFWEWWDARYGDHPSRASDYAALKCFWAYWGTSLESVEAQAQQQARVDYEYIVENGCKLGSTGFLKTEYDKWRQLETSRSRALAAKEKAAKEQKAKEDATKKAERIKSEKKLARVKKPRLYLIDNENKLDALVHKPTKTPVKGGE